jgi:hypothetical protein
VQAGILIIKRFLAATVASPRRDIRRCPATIFAISRMDRVMGRMMFLVISINTIKFMSGVGVPRGTRWAIIALMSVLTDRRLIDNQAGIVTMITGMACLVTEKVWG